MGPLLLTSNLAMDCRIASEGIHIVALTGIALITEAAPRGVCGLQQSAVTLCLTSVSRLPEACIIIVAAPALAMKEHGRAHAMQVN